VKNADLVFNICYGLYKNGIDLSQVDVVKWLDDNGVKHNVSKYRESQIAMDKTTYSRYLSGIDGLKFPLDADLVPVGTPIIRKYRSGACHIGVETYASKEGIVFDDAFMYQEYVRGREFSVAAMVTDKIQIMSPYEVVSNVGDELFFFGKNTRTELNPEISEPLLNRLAHLIREIHVAIDFVGLTRTDVKVDKDGNIYLLDINTMPNLDRHLTVLSKIFVNSGKTYDEAINELTMVE
jgi:predicted ATP-grasp superfamily ATP-dependent carboligase